MNESVTFLCGCNLASKLQFGYMSRFDSLGQIICPEHGELEYGYRTKSHIANGWLFDPRQIGSFDNAEGNKERSSEDIGTVERARGTEITDSPSAYTIRAKTISDIP